GGRQFGHGAPPEQMLRHRILDDASIPYVLVEINSSWRLPWDRHPNARAARVIATAIVSELQGRLPSQAPSTNVLGFDRKSLYSKKNSPGEMKWQVHSSSSKISKPSNPTPDEYFNVSAFSPV